MKEQQETLIENQKALASELGDASDKINKVAQADGESHQTTEVSENQPVEALASAGADPRSKAEYFGVSDD